MPNTLSPGAFAGIRIVDLTQGVAGPYATKALADFGADVIKVEPPGGDPGRLLWPSKDDVPGENRSGTFAFLNTNKRSIALDLREAADRETLLELVRHADILVESYAPGTMDRLGLGREVLRSANPALSVFSLSNFGPDGPCRDWKANDLVAWGMGGEMYAMGLASREPLKLVGYAPLLFSGLSCAVALAALAFGIRRGLRPQVVETSLFETMLATPDRRHATVNAFQFSGRLERRDAAPGQQGFASGPLPCRDGYAQFFARPDDLRRLLAMLGNPPGLDPAELQKPGAPQNPALKDPFDEALFAWLFERTKREVWLAAQEQRLPSAPINTVADVVADPVIAARGLFTEVQDPDRGTFAMLGRPFTLPRAPWALRRSAPRLDEHRKSILAEGAELVAPLQAVDESLRSPLQGVRIIDCGVVWAGPFAAMMLADLGAEVIKVENHRRPGPMVRAGLARPSRELVRAQKPWAGGYPNEAQIARPWNVCPTYVQSFRNKLACTMDSRTVRGREAFERLVRASDVLIENNAADTAEKLGLTYENLRAINPAIIVVRAPAFGADGPYREFRATGANIDAFTGLSMLRRYPDMDVSTNSQSIAPDAFAACHIAFAAIAALEHRRRTDEGQPVDVVQSDTAMGMIAGHFLDFALNGRDGEAIGNRDVFGAAPQGAFATAGDDRWMTLSVCNDEEWRALSGALGHPGWADEPRFATVEGRQAHQDDLESLLAAELRERDRDAVVGELQASGVAAGPVLDASDVLTHPQVRARKMLVPLEHPDAGMIEWIGSPWHFDAADVRARSAPTPLGEHNELVYREILGYSATEYAAFVRDGDVAAEFDPSVP